ncbi:MarR family winged helix-turn-helix transcriptional regulator [uncultured Pseudacidovorax sp.]|uniref:MarR family winged helix-turn-helix transcriptional regulator n=1 Tax=uncultured Pseudacidovorax sp. TaxID=679313 RepID=UPI0025E04162|nr:MarR family winged helix-turn-helix transcriptional regulator [uncultured Pseudacidovorax sp.]
MSTTVRPQGCTNFKLRQLGRRVSRLYDAELAQVGLKTTQYSLLSHVLKLGPLRPVDLARAMGLTASTLTRNLQPLMAAGWITQADGPDARSRLLHITDAGREKRAEAQRRWRAAQEQLNALLGLDRVLALHALLDDTIDRLRASQDGDADEGEEHE